VALAPHTANWPWHCCHVLTGRGTAATLHTNCTLMATCRHLGGITKSIPTIPLPPSSIWQHRLGIIFLSVCPSLHLFCPAQLSSHACFQLALCRIGGLHLFCFHPALIALACMVWPTAVVALSRLLLTVFCLSLWFPSVCTCPHSVHTCLQLFYILHGLLSVYTCSHWQSVYTCSHFLSVCTCLRLFCLLVPSA
jgi:hypothetical protein